MHDLLAQNAQRHAAILDAARPDEVAKQHQRGSLTARERIGLLLDAGADFIEYEALARPANRDLHAAADGVVIGTGSVHGKTAVVIAYDYTALGGSQGVNNHGKTGRAMQLAQTLNAPLFLLVEGGGGRAQELMHFIGGGMSDFVDMARLSGRVPLIGLGLGRAFAGHAIFLGESDVIIATRRAAIGVAGPPLVKAATGLGFSAEEIGGADIHERAGGADVLVDDDAAAISAARAYADFFMHPRVACAAVADRGDALRRYASAEIRRGEDLIALIADDGTAFALRPTWAATVLTSLARIDGRAVGIVASNPMNNGGAIDSDAADKIARFIDLCDAFGLPLVFLIDCDGFGGANNAALPRHAARIALGLARARVPLCTVVTGQLGGLAQTLLAGRSWRPLLHAMWPAAHYRGMGIGKADSDGTAFGIAEQIGTDDVIDPGVTRELLCRVLRDVPQLGPRTPARAIDPW